MKDRKVLERIIRMGLVVVVMLVIVLGAVAFIHALSQAKRAETELNQVQEERKELEKRLARLEKMHGDLIHQVIETDEAWRVAAQPVMGLYQRQLSYTGRGKANLKLEAEPKDLALALRPCQWKPPAMGCSKYQDDAPIYVGVLARNPPSIETATK